MISRDPSCIFVAADVGQAAVVVNWLGHHGIRARIMDTMTLGGLEGLTAWVGVSSRGIEVWVADKADSERARSLIAEHQQSLSALLTRRESAGPVSAQCEECGGTSEFSGGQRGTVQNCPHCGRYLDVPDDDVGAEDGIEDSTGDELPDTEAEMADSISASVRPSRLRGIQKPIILFALGCMALWLFADLLGVVVSYFGGHGTVIHR